MSWTDIAVGAGGAAGAVGLVGSLLITQAKHAVKRVVDEVVGIAVKDIQNDLTALTLKFAKETGGNSNGLRQKVDEVAKDVATLKGYIAGQSSK